MRFTPVVLFLLNSRDLLLNMDSENLPHDGVPV